MRYTIFQKDLVLRVCKKRLQNVLDNWARGSVKKAIVLVLAFGWSVSTAYGDAILNWSDNSDNEEGFSIERSQEGGEFAEIGKTAIGVATYVDETAVPGVDYSYRVRAFNEFGYSGYTNVADYYRNVKPEIDSLEDVTIGENESSEAITFAVADVDTELSVLSFSVSSSDEALLDASGVSFGGAGGERSLTLTPKANASGEASVTITVSDGIDGASSTFFLTVIEFVPATDSAVVANLRSNASDAVASYDPNTDLQHLSYDGGMISGRADDLRYQYVRLAGDASVTVKLSSYDIERGAAATGLMLRETLREKSKQVALLVDQGLNLTTSVRNETGAEATEAPAGNVASLDDGLFLRIQKLGSNISLDSSLDGENWTARGETEIGLSGVYFAGMALAGEATAAYERLVVEGDLVDPQIGDVKPPLPSDLRVAPGAILP